jgi:hypothetical protein
MDEEPPQRQRPHLTGAQTAHLFKLPEVLDTARRFAISPARDQVSGSRGDRSDGAAYYRAESESGDHIDLVGQDHVRPGAGPSASAGNAQAGHHVREGGELLQALSTD